MWERPSAVPSVCPVSPLSMSTAPMQRIVLPALLTSLFTIAGAAAGPLNLQGEFYADYSPLVARGSAPRPSFFADPPAAEAPPAPTRTAAPDTPTSGGGLPANVFLRPRGQP